MRHGLVRLYRSPMLVGAWALSISACAQLLGGLGAAEAPPERVSESDTPDAPAERSDRSGWLEGFGYRVAFFVQSTELVPLSGYSIPLTFETRAAMAARKLRETGADIRVTGSDGVTLAPHWIASNVNADVMTLWTKVDLMPGANVIFVYYGNPLAESTANLRETFIDGIIENPSFEGTKAWVASPPTNGEPGALQIQDGRASVALFRASGLLPSSLGFCQLLTFPAGQRYRVVFDVTAEQADHSALAVWAGAVGGLPLWRVEQGSGPSRGAQTGPIDAGTTRLCIGGTTLADPRPQDLSAYYQDLRVRLFSEADPMAGPAGPEEAR